MSLGAAAAVAPLLPAGDGIALTSMSHPVIGTFADFCAKCEAEEALTTASLDATVAAIIASGEKITETRYTHLRYDVLAEFADVRFLGNTDSV